MNDKLYRLEDVSEHRGEVIVYEVETERRMVLSLARWNKDKRRAYTQGEAAKILGLAKKRLVPWLMWLEYPTYEIVYATDVDNEAFPTRSTKYLSRQDIINIYDMLVRVRHVGKPSKDKFRKPRYGLPTRAELLAKLNETDVYYIKKDGEFVPVYRPEWL